MREMRKTKTTILAAVAAVAACAAAAPRVSPGPGTGYATDAYPGFDREENILERGRKTVGFFSWWKGPKMDSSAAQLAWADELVRGGSYSRARRAYDALVAAWPESPEAPEAQKRLAGLLMDRLHDWQDAFEEYKYLADFYPDKCDYDAVAGKMYEAALAMREEGKRILFFRIANTVDTRRAFEAAAVRAPGADFAPRAMLAAAELRESDGEFDKAVSVLENVRNLYPRSSEAREALWREATVRMKILSENGYNRARCLDTAAFLRIATVPGRLDADRRSQAAEWLAQAEALVEDEDWASTKFYDSRTRTRRSAASAYERFLKAHPASLHAAEARERIERLKEEDGK